MMSSRLLSMTALNFAYKFISYSMLFAVAQSTVGGLFVSPAPIFATALCLTVVGCIAEPIFVPWIGPFKSLLLGAPAMVFIIFFVSRIFEGPILELGEAIALTLCIGPIEYLFHIWVLRRLR